MEGKKAGGMLEAKGMLFDFRQVDGEDYERQLETRLQRVEACSHTKASLSEQGEVSRTVSNQSTRAQEVHPFDSSSSPRSLNLAAFSIGIVPVPVHTYTSSPSTPTALWN